MGIFDKIITFIYQIRPIHHSDTRVIFTKYGIYHAKVYHDSDYEYLALMSRNFVDLENPVVYIHSDFYACGHLSEQQKELALKMVSKEGGLFLYYSSDGSKIDALLKDINARRLETKAEVLHQTDAKAGLKAYKRVYYTISYILKDLQLSRMQLVSNDLKAIESAATLGIEITKQVPLISYGYDTTEK